MTNKLKMLPPANICQVTGSVSVPKISPELNKVPTNNKTPTTRIQINGKLLKMYLKSRLDKFHIVFKF